MRDHKEFRVQRMEHQVVEGQGQYEEMSRESEDDDK